MTVHDQIKYKSQLNSLKELFDYTRPINKVEKENDYTDYHIFYINGQVNSGVDYYLNHLNTLDMMIDEFKEIVNSHINNKEFLMLNWTGTQEKEIKEIKETNILSNTEMLLLKDITEGKSYKTIA